ncbi:MAG TPA: sugar phosphate isomerase/epimerase family protein [Sedimentisphaerales bacterium]|nr:sugar phosphate isomerase/epimerase family protein [Sedimentisphaerales bacterium]
MIKSCVTISLVPSLGGGPWVYWDDLQISIPKARAAGFDAVELFTASPDAVDTDKLSRLLNDNGMELAAVGTGAGKALHKLHLVSPESEIRRKARDFIGAMIDFGARFEAPAIIGSMQGCLEQGVQRAQALTWLAEGLDDLSQKASACGVKIIFEPLNRYETNIINTLGDGAALIKSLRRDNIVLLADLFHMNIEEESIAGSIRAMGGYIGHVHFVDSNRRAAGMGHIDLGEAARALKEIAFEGYASAEALPYPDPDTAAAQTITAFREFLVSK